jgi:hypothetical protein
MSATYRAIEITRPGKFAEVRRPLSDPGSGHVRIRVEACGVCHTKLFQLMLGFLLCAALERMKSPADSLEDPNLNGLPFKSPQAPAIPSTRLRRVHMQSAAIAEHLAETLSWSCATTKSPRPWAP